jgi:hypothetical protein
MSRDHLPHSDSEFDPVQAIVNYLKIPVYQARAEHATM